MAVMVAEAPGGQFVDTQVLTGADHGTGIDSIGEPFVNAALQPLCEFPVGDYCRPASGTRGSTES